MNFNNKCKNESLSKLEFAKHVFEEIHGREMRELKLALCGLSEEYKLDKIVEYLLVSVDTWFDWSEHQRENYIAKFNAMSVEDALQGKEIRVAHDLQAGTKCSEYKELSVDAASILKERKRCKDEVVRAVIEGALALLNFPAAIQQEATLDPSKANKYEVASREARNGEVECTINKSYVSCRCPSFKFGSVCKHSIAVAEKIGILDQHLQFISKASNAKSAGARSTLAEANVNKEVAGKKGARNKYPFRPSRSDKQHTTSNASGQDQPAQGCAKYLYTEIHHNDNPFVLGILPKEAKSCKQFKTDFCHRMRIIPNDLVFEHQERFYFPLNGDWKQKQASTKEEYIAIPPEVIPLLHESHKTYCATHFSLQI